MTGRRGRRRIGRTDRGRKLGWNGKLILTVLFCGFLLFLTAIVLGNYLRTLTPPAEETDSGISEITTEPDKQVHINNHIIIGRGVTFNSVISASETKAAVTREVSTDTSSDDTTPAVSPIEFDSLSILLRYPDEKASSAAATTSVKTAAEQTKGTEAATAADNSEQTYTGMKMLYTSPIVIATGYDTPGEVSLRDGIAALRLTTGVKYISAVFYISYTSLKGSESERVRDYEMALLYELFEYGISEVVICGYGSSDADVEEAARFSRELSARSGEKCVVGIAFPFEFYGESSSFAKMREQDLGNAFFAMDLISVQVPGLMTPEEVIYDRVRRTISLAVAYNIRVAVGCGNVKDSYSQVAEAIRGGASNVQGVIRD